MNALRDRVASNLVLLNRAGLALLVTLLATLFYVQHGLVGCHERLTHITLPIQRALARLDRAVGEASRREAQLSSARDSKQLEALIDRSGIERSLHEAHGELLELWPRAFTTAAHSGELHTLEDSITAFLASDAELTAAIERRHALQLELDLQLTSLDRELRASIESAQSISGVLRLDAIVELRQLHRGLQRSGSAPAGLVRELTVGSRRATLDNMVELVDAMLALGRLVGETARATSQDTLRAIAANELAPNRAQTARLLNTLQLQLQLQTSPALERLNELRTRYATLSLRIAGETQSQSLLQLRHQLLEEDARALQHHQRGIAHARALTRAVAQLEAATTQQVNHATSEAMSAAGRGRTISLVIAVICLFAALCIRHTVSALQARNRALHDAKDHGAARARHTGTYYSGGPLD